MSEVPLHGQQDLESRTVKVQHSTLNPKAGEDTSGAEASSSLSRGFPGLTLPRARRREGERNGAAGAVPLRAAAAPETALHCPAGQLFTVPRVGQLFTVPGLTLPRASRRGGECNGERNGAAAGAVPLRAAAAPEAQGQGERHQADARARHPQH